MTVLSTLDPVYGYNPDGSFAAAPSPSVLQFQGVPPLAGGFGNRIGIGGGGQDVNASAGIGLPFSGMASTLNTTTPGIGIATDGDPLNNQLTPYGSALNSSLTYALTGDVPGNLFLGPQWGIFDKNMKRVGEWDSVIKIEYRHDMKISDFPIEEGKFASYNKVQTPFDVRISFAIGSAGGLSKRAAFLADLEIAVQSLEMYTVITPEAIYPLANLIHLEYSRESRRGLNLLVVEVWVQEVRITTGSAFTTATSGKSPPSAEAVNTGGVQVKIAPPAESTTPSGIDAMPNLNAPTTPVIGPNMPVRETAEGMPGLKTQVFDFNRPIPDTENPSDILSTELVNT